MNAGSGLFGGLHPLTFQELQAMIAFYSLQLNPYEKDFLIEAQFTMIDNWKQKK